MDSELLFTFVREKLRRKYQARGPSPTARMPISRIQQAMNGGGSANGRFASGYLFHTAHMSQTISGARTCIDLGAAPGCQLLQLASLNPEVQFIGVDRCQTLISDGEIESERLGLGNISWVADDITTLSEFDDNSVDAVISTMTLHDLPDLASARACLVASSRVLSPGGAVYIEDYSRLKSAKSTAYFNQVNRRIPGDAFAELNHYSMHAAFKIDELAAICGLAFPDAKLYSTFIIPFLNVLKTPARDLRPEISEKLRLIYDSLAPDKRRDLDDLRKFFKLGGLTSDPFTAK